MSTKTKKYNRYLIASILLIVGIASANTAVAKPRHIPLDPISESDNSSTSPRGNVTIVEPASDNAVPFFNYQVSQLNTVDVWGEFVNSDGRFIYSIYMWTPTEGRLRIQNFNTSMGRTHSSGRWLMGLDEEALATDPICVEVWFERDDGLDGPDNPYDHAILRGETEEGVCASMK